MSDTNSKNIVVNYAFTPKKSADGLSTLGEVATNLEELHPSNFHITAGLHGFVPETMIKSISTLKSKTHTPLIATISCVNLTKKEATRVLNEYKNNNIKKLFVVRGIILDERSSFIDFKYSSDLIEFIQQNFPNSFDIFIGVYPEGHIHSNVATVDVELIKKKINLGAKNAISEFSFDESTYFNFVENCKFAGIDIPIIPAIMPILSLEQALRISRIAGVALPGPLLSKIESYLDEKSILQFGIEYISQLCNNLLKNGAPGLHFITLNNEKYMKEIYKNLNL